jgi:DNA-binding MarR family transcriptional regulator
MADQTQPTNPLEELDQLIHTPARLNIMTQLYVVESADYIFLKNLTGLTWGNLSAHISKLADAGYLKVKKSIVNKKTHSVAALTEKGRKAFEEYRERLMELIGTTLPGDGQAGTRLG